LWQIVAELSGQSEHELTAAYRKHGDLGAVAGTVLPEKSMRSNRHIRPAETDAGRAELNVSPSALQNVFRDIAAARGPAAKGALLRELLSKVSPPEAKYIVKIMTGDLRIGLKESLVEEAIAKAYEAPVVQVQRANMLLGNIGESLKLAAAGRLPDAKMRLFHPIGFMLASPAESAEDALAYFQNAWVEDKYDGIRAQAHCSGDIVRFFSRTRDEITESFPELPGALAGLHKAAILDGEIVAWSYLADTDESGEDSSQVVRHTSSAGAAPGVADEPGRVEARASSPVQGRALPFSALQQRLGRKRVSDKLMQDIPVAYLVFDVLYAGGELLIDQPLRDRTKKLEVLLTTPRKIIHHGDTETRRKTKNAQGSLDFGHVLAAEAMVEDRDPTTPLPTTYDERRKSVFPRAESQEPRAQIIRAPVFQASSPGELNQLFDAALARGNEGLMIKDPQSPYTPGRRGKSWLKLKRELATLDVVVTAVEWGHGKRIGVLSDYTFAVRDGDQLLNVGKAYSGLTDAEIAQMTKWFLDHTIEDQGFRRTVEPKIVLEVAFNNVMKSERHNSGYALRFPRIVRLRPDKLPEEVDTLQRVEEIYEKQSS
jgi:DNA ligase-1